MTNTSDQTNASVANPGDDPNESAPLAIISLVHAMYQSFNDRDFDRTASYVANDLEWRDAATGQTYRGPQGFRKFLARWTAEYPDAQIEVTSLASTGDRCTVRFVGRGTLQRPVMGAATTRGMRTQLGFRHELEFVNRKLARAVSTQDVCPLQRVFWHQTASAVQPAPRARLLADSSTSGSTTNFVVQCADNTPNGAILATAVLATCERDLATLQGWFGNIHLSGLPFHVTIQPGAKGGSHKGCGSTDLSIDAFDGTDSDLVRAVTLAEVVEVLSSNQGAGWDCGASNGEALSRVLSTEIYPNELNPPVNPPVTFASGSNWLDGGRPNWVDRTESTDSNFVSFGCGTLFLNWLHYQLGFTWNQIVQAGGSTFAETCRRLTGFTDAFTQFSNILAVRFPPGQPSGLATDNAFPIGPDVYGILLRWQNGPVFVIYGKARFQSPDLTTVQRLFPGQLIHQLGPALLNAIPTVPVDGTLLRDEQGAIWVIYGAAKFHVPDPLTLQSLYPNVPWGQLWNAALTAFGSVPVERTVLEEENGTLWAIHAGAKYQVPNSASARFLLNTAAAGLLWNGAVVGIPDPATGSTFILGSVVDPWLQGKVTDTVGAPIAWATVTLRTPGSYVQGTTNAGGYYSISMPHGPDDYGYVAAAGEPGFVPQPEVSVALSNPGAIVIQNFVLERTRPVTISGRVASTKGAAIPGAIVTGQNGATAVADGMGQYSLTIADPGPYLVPGASFGLTAAAAGFETANASLVLTNGAAVSQDFVLVKLSTLTGLVTDDKGKPLSGASVILEYYDSQAMSSAWQLGTTDATGTYTIVTGGASGTATALAPGFERGDASVTLPSEATVTQNFALVPAAPGNLAGKVTYIRTAAAIAGATVTANCLTGGVRITNIVNFWGFLVQFIEPDTTPVSTVTDSAGNYLLANLPSGLTTIDASATGYEDASGSTKVVAGQEVTLNFALFKSVVPKPPPPPPGPHPQILPIHSEQ